MNFLTLSRLILTFVFTTLLISCSNEEQSNISSDVSKSKEILKRYADIHNSGLDYIKSDAQRPRTGSHKNTCMECWKNM